MPRVYPSPRPCFRLITAAAYLRRETNVDFETSNHDPLQMITVDTLFDPDAASGTAEC